MADPYVPGLAAARSVYDQGIAPLAQKVQGFLKGTAGLPGTVKDYALETIQSEGGPTTKVMADLLTLGQGMRQGLQDDPLRFMAEMNPLVGGASDLFETNQVLNLAQTAEESGDLEKAQTLRELANTIVLMGMVPGGPPAKKTLEQKLKDMEEKRRKLTEETGLPYVPSNKPDLGEGRRIDINESPQDTALRKELEDKRLADIELDRSPTARAARAEEFGFDMDNIYYHGTSSDFTELQPSTVGDLGGGIYITPNPEKASGYAAMRKFMKRQTNNASPNVLPLRIKSDLNYLDLQGRSILPFDDVRINNLKEQGYDGIRQFDADGNVVQINVFDPKNIRSINADFNPLRMNEADLQAGIASLGAREGMA